MLPSITPAPAGFGVVGRQLDVVLVLNQTCDERTTMTAEVSVVDPSSQDVAVDPPTRMVQPDPMGVRTTVSFVPQVAGSYHLVARFQPNLGIVQADVLIAANRTNEAPLYTFDAMALSDCEHVELTSRQLVLCTTPGTEVYGSDGGQIQKLDAKASAWADGALWVLSTQDAISRWTDGTLPDGGAGLVRSPDVAITWANSGSDVILLPSTDDVVALNMNQAITRFAAVDGGLSITGDGQLTGGTWARSAAWRSGDNILAVSMHRQCKFSFDTGTSVCPPEGNLSPTAMDRSGVWQAFTILDGAGSHVTLSVDSWNTSASLALPMNLTPETGSALVWETSPMLVTSTALFVFSAPLGGLSLDALPHQGVPVSASATAVTVLDGPTLKIYRR